MRGGTFKGNREPKSGLEFYAACWMGGRELDEIVRFAVTRRIAECHGHRAKAAASLGISEDGLRDKLRKWGVLHERFGRLDYRGHAPAEVQKLSRQSRSRRRQRQEQLKSLAGIPVPAGEEAA